ncbi:MAG: amphi-Trp domain-containing protein [Candidatus Levybacteria bacterium]|nr:amphi-Trp domain-containing protein [Candidatus Levybacteria bacterium]
MSHEERKKMSRQETGRLLESVGRQLIEKGEIEIRGKRIVLPEDIEVEIEYKRKEGKNKFEIELRWYGGHPGTNAHVPMGTELDSVLKAGKDVVKIASLADCSPWKTIQFTYPTSFDQAILKILPDMEVRAYSTVCTHKGKSLLWDDQLKRLHCPAHDAVFSAETGEKIAGPGGSSLKKIRLQIKEGNIFAVGIDGESVLSG